MRGVACRIGWLQACTAVQQTPQRLPLRCPASWCGRAGSCCCCCASLLGSRCPSAKPKPWLTFAAGAGVYFTTMITQGVSYRYGSYWRANAAPVSREAGQRAPLQV